MIGVLPRWTRLRCLAMLAVLPALTGCVSRTRVVQQVAVSHNLKTATLSDLMQGINERADQIHSLALTVNIAVSTGGERKGSVTEYTSLTGYIVFDRPNRLRILGLLPVLHTKAFDMASNGSSFKLLIPSRGKAFEGADKITRPSDNPLENLRPYIFVQALTVGAVSPEEFSYLAGETRLSTDVHGKNVEEDQDYDLGVLRRIGQTNALAPSRIVHISRKDLLPFKQDVYNSAGVIETQALYDDYQDFNGIRFPSVIRIRRPQEEYEIRLTVQKLVANQAVNDDQFDLKFPDGIALMKLP